MAYFERIVESIGGRLVSNELHQDLVPSSQSEFVSIIKNGEYSPASRAFLRIPQFGDLYELSPKKFRDDLHLELSMKSLEGCEFLAKHKSKAQLEQDEFDAELGVL